MLEKIRVKSYRQFFGCAVLTGCFLFGSIPAVEAKTFPGNPALSRQAAAECMVLLKNDREALPILPGDRIAVFGAGQIEFVKGGWGSGDVCCDYVVNLLDGLQAQEESGKFRIAPALAAAYRENPHLTLTEDLVKQARQDAEKALIVISRNSGEGADRTPDAGDYLLSKQEEEMLQLVSQAGFDRVIVVLNVGGVMDCSWVNRYPIDAILNVWQPGMEGGNAAADVLTGAVNPSGKLTSSWAAAWDKYPSSNNFFNSGNYVLYEEDIFVGYRYFETFDPNGEEVCYPFGFGLSYTTFELSEVISQIHQDEIKISLKVKNTGKYPGREVIQLYYSAPQGKLGRPARELGAFVKTSLLQPGESQLVTLQMPVRYMAAYDDDGRTGEKSCWVLEPGRYKLYVGTSVRDLLPDVAGIYPVNSLKVLERCAERMPPKELPKRLESNGNYKILNNLDCVSGSVKENRSYSVLPAGSIRIEAEDFDQFGGAAGIESFIDVFGVGKCTAGMDGSDCWISFPLEVEQAGKYAICFRMANGREAIQDLMDLSVNGQAVDVDVNIPQTGDGFGLAEWYNFINLDPVFVTLPAGSVELKIQSRGVFANMDYFSIVPADQYENFKAQTDQQLSEANAEQEKLRKSLNARRKRPDTSSKIMIQDVAGTPALMDAFLAQLSDLDLAMLAGGAVRTLPNGGTGRIGVLEDFGSPGVETCDGPAGIHLLESTTAWPCSTALASSWDVDLARKVGEAVAKEALLNNADIWLAPGMNIHRNPMCGRNFEYYSEDPLLSGKMASAITHGVQSHDVGVTLKHFAFNNKEFNRNNSDSRISERAIREIYLKGFEIAVKEADPWCIMSSYNFANGMETSENWDLLTGILREEWNYPGVVMTDWGNNSIHYSELAAGNNVKMPFGHQDTLLMALETGKITREQLEDNARIVLNLILRSGVLTRKGI